MLILIIRAFSDHTKIFTARLLLRSFLHYRNKLAERIIEALNTSMCINESLNRVRVLRNDKVLLFDQKNKLTLDNQTVNDLLQIINANVKYKILQSAKN